MKLSIWLIGISAGTLAFSAQAQNATPSPSGDAPVTQPAPPSSPPPVSGPATPESDLPDSAIPPARPAPPPMPAQPQSTTSAGAQPAEVEAAPPPPESYPTCSRTVRDECRNPGGK